MHYQQIYNNLIHKARSKQRAKGKDVYYEAHHIIPRCLGGEGETKQWTTHSNIVLLTAREHFVAHRLLCRMYPDNRLLAHALWRMIHGNKRMQQLNLVSSRAYQECKELKSRACQGISPWNKGKKSLIPMTAERREHFRKMSSRKTKGFVRIFRVDTNELVKTCYNSREAAEFSGVSMGNILNIINGGRLKTGKGYRFERIAEGATLNRYNDTNS